MAEEDLHASSRLDSMNDQLAQMKAEMDAMQR